MDKAMKENFIAAGILTLEIGGGLLAFLFAVGLIGLSL
jgi:hypothetical protein